MLVYIWEKNPEDEAANGSSTCERGGAIIREGGYVLYYIFLCYLKVSLEKNFHCFHKKINDKYRNVMWQRRNNAYKVEKENIICGET